MESKTNSTKEKITSSSSEQDNSDPKKSFESSDGKDVNFDEQSRGQSESNASMKVGKRERWMKRIFAGFACIKNCNAFARSSCGKRKIRFQILSHALSLKRSAISSYLSVITSMIIGLYPTTPRYDSALATYCLLIQVSKVCL